MCGPIRLSIGGQLNLNVTIFVDVAKFEIREFDLIVELFPKARIFASCVRVIATKANSLESISYQTLPKPVVELFRVINLPDHFTVLLPYQETECTKQWINQTVGYSIRN